MPDRTQINTLKEISRLLSAADCSDPDEMEPTVDTATKALNQLIEELEEELEYAKSIEGIKLVTPEGEHV